MSLNKVVLMGRLTKDPEIKTTQSGTSVASFSIAVDRKYTPKGEGKKTDFINIVAWRNSADFIGKFFHKGDMIAIVGNLQTRTWEDKDGGKRYATEVIVDEVSFCGSKGSGGGGADSDGIPGFSPIGDDEDLPF